MAFIIFAVTAFTSYWYETELPLFLGSGFIMARFLYGWYEPLWSVWPPNHGRAGKLLLGCLPAAAFFVILISLLTTASYDVVGIWVIFYIVLGYAWIRFGVFLMESVLDLFCIDDTIYRDNKAAIIPVSGGFLGVTLIYVGANTGDGPGWWVVLIAGSLGLTAWIGLAWLINRFTGISERITVDRSMGGGIRFGAYLLASGLLLGRASGGDWTSFYATCVEFMVCWPVIPLALLVTAAELFIMRMNTSDPDTDLDINLDGDRNTGLHTYLGGSIPFSLFWGCAYLVYAVIFLTLLPPLGENLFAGLLGVKL